jgi:hypothetical protein
MSNIQLSTPASNAEMAEALKFLFASLPLPRGTDPERAIFGYIQALAGLSLVAIENGIGKVMRGECEDVSRKFCPHPPELAAICRGASYVSPTASPTTGKLYGYRAPASKVIERNCTKQLAFRLIDQGIHPRGSIWCPGQMNEKPEFGDLFGPDPSWQKPFPLSEQEAA